METITALLTATGLVGAVVSAAVGLAFRRIEKKLDADKEARAQREANREKFEEFQVKSMTAVMALSEANALALQNGKCNGETHAALDYLKQVKHEQRDFLVHQGIKQLFD